MRILIVDDDDNKRLHLLRFVAEQIPSADLSEARSYQSALRRLMGADYDLVILDMTMPSYDITAEDEGGRHQAYAGRELLKQMDARGITAQVVVVTQYERLRNSAPRRHLFQSASGCRALLRVFGPSREVTTEEIVSVTDESGLGATIALARKYLERRPPSTTPRTIQVRTLPEVTRRGHPALGDSAHRWWGRTRRPGGRTASSSPGIRPPSASSA